MNDIQAALGLSQMKRLDKYVDVVIKLQNIMILELKNLSLITPWQHLVFILAIIYILYLLKIAR